MVHPASRPHTTVALLENEPAVEQPAICPMCHTAAPVTQGGVEAGGEWSCVRCGQHWDAARLAAVAGYAAWVVATERAANRLNERSQDAGQDREPSPERLDRTP
jgi:ribosomal protein L37AE/L43A